MVMNQIEDRNYIGHNKMHCDVSTSSSRLVYSRSQGGGAADPRGSFIQESGYFSCLSMIFLPPEDLSLTLTVLCQFLTTRAPEDLSLTLTVRSQF
jgi:hypothetical protein